MKFRPGNDVHSSPVFNNTEDVPIVGVNSRPPMYQHGKTLFLTIAYPPNPTASSVVNRHLLDQFDPKSFVVITGFFPGARRAEIPKEVRQYYIYISFEFLSSKIHRFIARIQRFTIPVFLNLYISFFKPERIIIGYPDLYWLDICSSVAIKKNIPFIPYLHDTIVEATYYGPSKELAKKVQQRAFGKAYNIAVMSEGMKELYRKKYQLPSVAWQHIYPEKPLVFKGEKINRAHWSGDVYEINYKAVIRLNNALVKLGMQFSISNGKSREQLKAFGIEGEHIQKVFYPRRTDYLQHLSASKILLVGLNYTSECSVHEDELATIFSTKTPEYLGSDSLIVYHGPSHYFLAKFLLENDCGIVIDTRDENQLLHELKNVIDNYAMHASKIKNAARSLSIFDASLVANKLIRTLDVQNHSY
ncbi:MAG: hypothetical protein ABIO04_01970 [Ferruginibacter sp.]